jgi:hypothetical protein
MTRILDAVQTLAAIEAFEPAPFVDAVAAELPAGQGAGDPADAAALAATDAALVAALAAADDFATRVMRIRLDHALADDTSIAPPTRRVFAQTVANYADQLPVLAQRARDVAARAGARDADGTADIVVECAQQTLALRGELRAGVLALVAQRARAAFAGADHCARDRTRADAERKRWSATRRELEALAADPERVTRGAFAARVGAWPEQIDEPEPEAPPSLADLLELE